MDFIHSLRRTLRQFLRTDIHLVAEDSHQWVFHWVTHHLIENLNKLGRPVYSARNPWGYHHQILHFIDRYAFLHGDYARLAESNHVFVNWYHGSLASPDPEIQKLYEKLPDALPKIRRLVVSCEEGRQALLEANIPAEKITRIPIGINLKEFNPVKLDEKAAIRKRLGIPEGAFCIGSFQKDGQGWGDGMEPKLIKGPDIFVETVAQLYGRHDHIHVILTGPSRGYIKARLEDIGIPYQHFYYAHYPDVEECYHATDVTLITSRSEGGPKAFMESWATGVPVVSTKMGMPADWIVHEESGLLAEVEDSVTLAAQVDRLIWDDTLYRQCREAGLEAVKALDWLEIARQYNDKLYAPILDTSV